MREIERDQAIKPERGEPIGVHVELEPFATVVPGIGGPFAEMGAAGEGAYVEFDLPPTALPTYVGPRKTALIPTEMPLKLDRLTPVFVRVRRWWNLWYIWR